MIAKWPMGGIGADRATPGKRRYANVVRVKAAASLGEGAQTRALRRACSPAPRTACVLTSNVFLHLRPDMSYLSVHFNSFDINEIQLVHWTVADSIV